MPDLGFLRGLITILTLSTFIGICWWAYRPGNRARFEEDGWLAFGDEEPVRGDALRPVKVAAHDDSDQATHRSAEERQT